MGKPRRRRSPSGRAVWFYLPSDWWLRFNDLVTDVLKIPLKAFFDGKTGISERHLRRSKKYPRRISKNSLIKLASAFGYQNDWRAMFQKLGGKPPPLPTEAPAFREIQAKSWQRLPLVECPHPYPDGSNSTLPFQRELGGDIYYAAGWIVRLQANAHYRVTCDFVRNAVWPEIEIVLYERVPHTESWKRGGSFGAVTSLNRASDVTPQVEEWLITCWGKKVIADAASWFDFVPETSDLDTTGAGLLKVRFSAPNRQSGEGGLPVSTSAAESSPEVHVQLVE